MALSSNTANELRKRCLEGKAEPIELVHLRHIHQLERFIFPILYLVPQSQKTARWPDWDITSADNLQQHLWPRLSEAAWDLWHWGKEHENSFLSPLDLISIHLAHHLKLAYITDVSEFSSRHRLPYRGTLEKGQTDPWKNHKQSSSGMGAPQKWNMWEGGAAGSGLGGKLWH